MTNLSFAPWTLLLCAGLNSAAALPDVGPVTNISRFGLSPSWSPDSQRMVFRSTNASGIWIYDRRTGQTLQIHPSGCLPAWHPKENVVAFWKPDQNPWILRADGSPLLLPEHSRPGNIWLIRADGSYPQDMGIRGGSGIAWSPDAKHLISYDDFPSPRQHLMLFETAGWKGTNFDAPLVPSPKDASNRRVGCCSWTPEGHLLFTTPVGTANWQSNEVREYSTTGNLISRTTLNGSPKPFHPRISPDGKFILFDCGSRGIWIASRDGSEVRQLLAIGAAPAWSPDGRYIAFDDSSCTPNVRNGIFLAPIRMPSGNQLKPTTPGVGGRR
jgi:Tol biopolymer transport system component